MKKRNISFRILLSLCILLAAFSAIPVSAAESGSVSDEEYLQQRAEYLAKVGVSALYGEETAQNITLAGPYEIYASTSFPDTAAKAYAGYSLNMFSPKEENENYKLFFIYQDENPLTYMVLCRSGGDWQITGTGGLSLKKLLFEKEKLEKQFPDEEIGYFFADGAVMLFTPNRANGYLLLAASTVGYDAGETALVRTRDYAVGQYEYVQEIYRTLEETGMTVEEFKKQATLGSAPNYMEQLLNGKTYPVWQFWLPRIGIPAAVVLILAGAVVLIVRRKKKSE